jgi:lysophospholipase L1-like esterase
MNRGAGTWPVLRSTAIGVILLALVVEVVFRIVPPANLTRDRLIRGGNPEVALIKPHPYLSYVLNPGLSRPGLHHNALGYRGPEVTRDKPAGVVRILCLGASSTYGVTAGSDGATWPARLQWHLTEALPSVTFEVVNGGVPGYSTFESMIDLEIRGVELQPDIVIIYAGFNDLRAATWPNVQPDNTQFRKSWGLEKPPLVALLELSQTFLLARWFMSDYRNTEVALSRYVVVPEDGAAFLGGARSLSPVAFASFIRNLSHVIAIARLHHIRVLAAVEAYGEATIAGQFADLVDQGMSGFANSLAQLVDEMQPGQDVQIFDARKSLPLAPGVFVDGVHMSDAGSDRLGRLVKNRLMELGWVGSRASAKPSE